MRIGIDARVLEKRMTGIGRYLLDILRGLILYDNSNEYFLFSCTEIPVENDFYHKIKTGKSFLPSKIYAPLWLNIILPKYLKRYNIDIFFTVNHLIPIRGIKNIKTIAAVHDLAHKINKDFHPLSYRSYLDLFLPSSMRKSDSILTVSESSKKDIINYFNIMPSKIEVIYQAADSKFSPGNVSEDKGLYLHQKYNLPGKYILFVGAIEKRKNIEGILKISDLVHNKNNIVKTVLIGKPGHNFRIIDSEIKKREKYVTYLNYVDDEDLPAIYKQAFLFIFPSFYEGFGIPPLEAMQIGLPVLASNVSSLPEVVGNGGILHRA